MKSQNKHSFEEEWRNAFQDAEQSADDAIWTRLDSHLANQEAQKYKKEYRYFSIAATIALLLISLGFTVWWLDHSKKHNESLSSINSNIDTSKAKQEADAASPASREKVQSPEPSIQIFEGNSTSSVNKGNNTTRIQNLAENAETFAPVTPETASSVSKSEITSSSSKSNIASPASKPKMASSASRKEASAGIAVHDVPPTSNPLSPVQETLAYQNKTTTTTQESIASNDNRRRGENPSATTYISSTQNAETELNNSSTDKIPSKGSKTTSTLTEPPKEVSPSVVANSTTNKAVSKPHKDNDYTKATATSTTLEQADLALAQGKETATDASGQQNSDPLTSTPTGTGPKGTLSKNQAITEPGAEQIKESKDLKEVGIVPESPYVASTKHDSIRYTYLQPIPFRLLPVPLPALEPLEATSPIFVAATAPVSAVEPRTSRERKWWIAAAFSTLYFDPNFKANYQDTHYANPTPTHSSIGSVDFEDIVKPDFSYLLSLEVGYKISRRWQIKSGIQYLHYNSTLNTRAFLQPDNSPEKIPLVTRMLNNESTEYTRDIAFGNTARLNTTESSVKLHNQYQYLSIPIQAGFVLNPEDAITLAINAGFAADVFLGNSIKGDDEYVQSASVRPSDNTTYRSITFNGLLGLDLNYTLSERYALSFQPLCRAALHSSTVPNANIKSKPITAGAGLGLKINF